MTETLTVILGAGASFDAVNTEQTKAWRPPLAKELFERRDTFDSVISDLPEVHAIVQELRMSVADGASVEAELQALQLEADAGDAYKRMLVRAVQIYLMRILWNCGQKWSDEFRGQTNYAVLTHRLEQWRRAGVDRSIAYVTFNYDILLEQALRPILTINDLPDYIGRPDTQVFKVHGSVNWCHPVTYRPGSTSLTSYLIHEAPEPSSDFLMSEDIPRGQTPEGRTRTGDPALPALAIPTTEKHDLVLPPEHATALEAALRTTAAVLVIGWRGADKHFAPTLKLVRSGVPMHVVSTGDGFHDLASNLAAQGLGFSPTHAAPSFSALIRDRTLPAAVL